MCQVAPSEVQDFIRGVLSHAAVVAAMRASGRDVVVGPEDIRYIAEVTMVKDPSCKDVFERAWRELQHRVEDLSRMAQEAARRWEELYRKRLEQGREREFFP